MKTARPLRARIEGGDRVTSTAAAKPRRQLRLVHEPTEVGERHALVRAEQVVDTGTSNDGRRIEEYWRRGTQLDEYCQQHTDAQDHHDPFRPG